jgi:two-component system, chemotaxis family, CheB/CheR fusion protein
MPNRKKPEQNIPAETARTNSISSKISRSRFFPIVCIGGSAGSLPALELFFTNMPADSGMAFVVVTHLDPNYEGNMSSVISKFTPMTVCQATDGVAIMPNTVYCIPPNRDMGIHNSKLLLFPSSRPNGYSLSIDYFLQSLAEDQWNKAVAIILSGMGSDGETGVRMIKEKLGMVMVQDPQTAQYDSMPKASIGTNLVDYVLSPEEMPIKLIQYLNHPALNEEASEQVKADTRDANAIQKILLLLRTQTSHDFSKYKKNTITRRIDRRLAFNQLSDYAQYIVYLRENPHEINVLFNELLIGVTKFFRDSPAFDALQKCLAEVLKRKGEQEPVRIWVAGCSTGEEAYSIAMLVQEHFDAHGNLKPPKIQIFATDLDMEGIDTARTGLYNTNIVADVSPQRITRFFTQKENGYQVNKELREMIVFAQHNLIKDAPFTRLDLLSCRNVMIYLNTELQKKIIPIYHYSLNEKGILFMGPAETVGGFSEMFAPVDPKWKIFERKANSATVSKMIDFPFNVSRQPIMLQRPEEISKSVRNKVLADEFNKLLLEQFTPTSLLINERGDILYINGRTGKFLELNSGEAEMNIFKMVREDLKYPLVNAIHQARALKKLVEVSNLRIKEDGKIRLVSLKVNLLQDITLQGLLVVIFSDGGLLKKITRSDKRETDPQHKLVVEELEKELAYTKEQLNTTIEQMETSLEELKSTNEELQSTNEELQSTNEESLTTKEEMQSLNEELMTINAQFQAKADEHTLLNNDMKNLLDNTEIGTIFLDNRLTILRFTPQVKKLFKVIATDVGRTITDIAFKFDYDDLERSIHNVIESLIAQEAEIKTRDGEWYNLRIMPYRTLDNFISGAVLTFSKITKFKIVEKQLIQQEGINNILMEKLELPALLLDGNYKVVKSNTAFRDHFHVNDRKLASMTLETVEREMLHSNKLVGVLSEMETEEVRLSVTSKANKSEKPKSFDAIITPFADRETHEASFFLVIISGL